MGSLAERGIEVLSVIVVRVILHSGGAIETSLSTDECRLPETLSPVARGSCAASTNAMEIYHSDRLAIGR